MPVKGISTRRVRKDVMIPGFDSRAPAKEFQEIYDAHMQVIKEKAVSNKTSKFKVGERVVQRMDSFSAMYKIGGDYQSRGDVVKIVYVDSEKKVPQYYMVQFDDRRKPIGMEPDEIEAAL